MVTLQKESAIFVNKRDTGQTIALTKTRREAHLLRETITIISPKTREKITRILEAMVGEMTPTFRILLALSVRRRVIMLPIALIKIFSLLLI